VLFIADEPLAATVLAETLGVALPRIESALAASRMSSPAATSASSCVRSPVAGVS
jgi:hypothetical protein